MSDVFISYSHKDRHWLDRLLTHLQPLSRRLGLKVFSDLDLETDELWERKIEFELSTCRAAVAIITANFVASSFITQKELPALVSRRRSSNFKIYSVFASPCAYTLFPEIAEFQGFNKPDAPLSGMTEHEQENIFAALAIQLGALVPQSTDQNVRLVSGETSDRPEINYADAENQRLFSDVTVSLPRLSIHLGTNELSGFSFERCTLKGPSVINAQFPIMSNCAFGVYGGDIGSLFLRPSSNTYVNGILHMSHLNLQRCQTDDVGFLNPSGELEAIIRAQMSQENK